ncbi:hypothetical protein GGF50DRAFT_121929 [Schizophyllum commune]
MALLMVAAAVWTAGWTAIVLLSPPSPFPSLPPRELALTLLGLTPACAVCPLELREAIPVRAADRPRWCRALAPSSPYLFSHLPEASSLPLPSRAPGKRVGHTRRSPPIPPPSRCYAAAADASFNANARA